MIRWNSLLASLLVLTVYESAAPATVTAYEELTHERVSEVAARTPFPGYAPYSVIEMGSANMGFALGPDTVVEGKTVVEWIRLGANLEDRLNRPLNHFHNPLAFWTVAGLLQFGQSSILWGQNPGPDQGWSWGHARQHLYDALTKPSLGERDQALTKMLRALGQQMHLVQDAASPAHTRNDPHPFPISNANSMVGGNYEKFILGIQRVEEPKFEGWLAGKRELEPLAPPTGPIWPDPAWSALPSDPQAPAAVARLIDTDRYRSTDAYTGVNPAVTAEPLIGLAEYTNANFFSEDSRWTSLTGSLFRPFVHPSRSSAVETVYNIPLPSGEVVKRKYYQKIANGDTGYRLATVGFLRDYYIQYPIDPGRAHDTAALDEKVWGDYAERLLPRAVGYSAALLQYFFRAYFWTSGLPEAFNIVNPLPEGMQGQLTVYAVRDDDRRQLGGFAVNAPASSISTEAYVLPKAGPWPCTNQQPCGADHWINREYCLLVFRGRLGSEPDGVAVGWTACTYEEPPPPPPPTCNYPCDGGA